MRISRPATEPEPTPSETSKTTSKDALKVPFSKFPGSEDIVALDPGTKGIGAALLRRPNNAHGAQLVLCQYNLSDKRQFTENISGFRQAVEVFVGDMSPYPFDLLCSEYPIPFYKAHRDSIASTNMAAGIFIGRLHPKNVQLFAPGNHRILPAWNVKGTGKESAGAWLDSKPQRLLTDACQNLLWTPLDDLTHLYKVVEPKAERVKLDAIPDAVSALGVLIRALEYNGIPLPELEHYYLRRDTL